MIPDEQPALPPRDHNRPPSPVEALSAEQKEALEPYRKRRDEIVAAAQKKNVVDRATAGDAGDIMRVARDVFAILDADRRERTDPYRRAADAAKGVVDEFWQPVVDAIADLRGRLKKWDDEEEARIRQQQREQEAEMARMRAAAQPPAESPAAPPPSPPPAMREPARRKVRGDLGATVSSVDKVQYRVVDIKAVPDWIMASPTVHEAVITVVKAMAKHAGQIPGIETSTTSDIQIR